MFVDIESQDTSLPIEEQQNLNFSTSPMLEVFSETRPQIEFREKRQVSDENLTRTDHVESHLKQGAVLRRLQRMAVCGSGSCRTKRKGT